MYVILSVKRNVSSFIQSYLVIFKFKYTRNVSKKIPLMKFLRYSQGGPLKTLLGLQVEDMIYVHPIYYFPHS